MLEEMREMLGEFIAESRELLESAQTQMVHLEGSADAELVNGIFRALHTVKGSSGFLELEAITRVAHAAEDLLNALRKGERTADAAMIDVLLQSTDRLLAYLNELEQGQEDLQTDEGLVTSLRAMLDGDAAEPPAAAPVEPAGAAAAAGLSAELVDMIEPFVHDTRQVIGLVSQALNAAQVHAADLQAILEPLAASLEFFGVADAQAALAELQAALAADPVDRDAARQALTQLGQSVDRVQALALPAEAPEVSTPAASDARPAAEKGSAAPPAGSAKKALVEQTLRVDVNRLDDLLNLVGELVLEKNHIAAMAGAEQSQTLSDAANRLNLVTSELQMAVMKVRMQPVDRLFSRYPRLVREVSRQCGKEVRLVVDGGETELDKSVIERLGDPLVHLLRNAVDHGVEPTDVRTAAGKDPCGTVRLSAGYEGNTAVVTVADDGAGIDAERLRDKAIQRGVLTAEQAAEMSPREMLNLIFAPGFSMAKQVTDVSGRGVGMDVVRQNVEQLGGSVEVETELGAGSKMHIRIPLTLAIVQALLTVSRGQRIAFPLANVVEIVRGQADHIQMLNRQPVFRLRNRNVPIVRMDSKGFRPIASPEELDGTYLVVMSSAEMELAAAVDQLVRQEEVVIKPLGKMFRGIKEFSGAAILGDGSVTLIADIPALAAAARQSAHKRLEVRSADLAGTGAA